MGINWHKAWLVALPLLLAQGVARADIYHCIKPGGGLLFTDLPCPPGTRANGVTTSPPPVPFGEVERQRAIDVQMAERRRIDQLEQEVAQLRAALQSVPAQAAPEAAYAPDEAYPYPPESGVVVVGRCRGRDCQHDDRPERGGDGPHHGASANPPSHPIASPRPPT
jgi:hypothetical protein